MGFVDECVVYATAGNGGSGSAHLHSEPYKPEGGPDGGDGGDGGSVIFEVSRGLHDLSGVADHPHQRAGHGGPGRSNRRSGPSGADRVVPVPDGTVVFDEDGFLADLVGEGARAVVARGGRGGRGNTAFVSSLNRVPRTSEPGERGEDKRLRVELRTVADVGLVGLPNAGKSTLLSRLTAAKPKIADYPFTTLTPNLGVAGDTERFVVADIPGLIEGASEGKGLGHRFLRHILRCRALLIVVDLSGPDPAADLAILRGELAAYDEELALRPAIIAGTKTDLVDDPAEATAMLVAAAGKDEVLAVSAMTGEGIDALLERVGLLAEEAEESQPEREPFVVLRPGRPKFTVELKAPRRWVVGGPMVERWIMDTDLDDPSQVEQLQKKLVKAGVERKLLAMGAKYGDEVTIRESVFEFLPDPASQSG